MNYLVTMIALSLLFGCSDPTGRTDDVKASIEGVFILNEGNFGSGNGSLSFYDFNEKTIQNNIFYSVNGRLLGDVVQSMTLIDSLGYIVVNNSNKIEIISLKTWLSKATINLPAGSSPRMLTQVSPVKAYVSNLYTNDVTIINLHDNSVGGSIAVGWNPEDIIFAFGQAYVANSGWGYDNTISVIDVETDQVVKTLTVGDFPSAMDMDEFGNIHVVCEGSYGDFSDPLDDTMGGIYVIDTSDDTVQDSIIINGHPSGVCTNQNGRGFYVLNGTVYSYSVNNVTQTPNEFISGFFYDMNVNKVNGQLYSLDAKDYAQSGDLNIYDQNGLLQETYMVGIVPGEVVFVYGQ